MIALLQVAGLAFVALAVLMRSAVGKWSQWGNRAWVTGRTGSAMVVTDRIF